MLLVVITAVGHKLYMLLKPVCVVHLRKVIHLFDLDICHLLLMLLVTLFVADFIAISTVICIALCL